MKKRGKSNFGQVRAILGKFRQVWASLDKLGQGKWKKRGRNNKKRE